VKDEKVKGHQRIETWSGNPLMQRKGSNIISKGTQSLQNSSASKMTKGYKAYLTNKKATDY